jgi:hypothetical protein
MKNPFKSLQLIMALAIVGLAVLAFVYKPKTKPQPISSKFPSSEEFRQLDYIHQADVIKTFAKEDPMAAWQYLKDGFMVNGEVVGNAHDFAHLIGNAIYEKFGIAGITSCDETFAFGCFHGVTQKLLETEGVSAIRKVQDRCTEIFPPAKSQNYTGCIHGMGHGLFTYERFNLAKALEDCDGLDSLYQSYCYDGVFMEHVTDMAKNEYNPNQPWQFCEALNQKYQYNCARYQSQVFLGQAANGNAVANVGLNCAKTSNLTLSTTCFESLGYYVTQTHTGDLNQILDDCGKIKSPGKEHCLLGATREVKFQAYTGWQKTRQQICAMLPPDLITQCQDTNQFTPTN